MEHRNWLSILRPGIIGLGSCVLLACDGASGTAGQGRGALAVGDDDAGTACAADPGVEDREPPVLVSHTLDLWPPNHKFHGVAVEDCVSAMDACDGAVRGEFIWASSDEPIDSIGDGHHAPDIGLAGDVMHVCVRSERQGPKDGRVYKLGVRVTDSAGNSSEGECLVIVDHDQRGVVGKDSGEAYRVLFDAAQVGPACDGSDSENLAGAGGSGQAGTGDEGQAGTGDEGQAGTGDEGQAGSGDEGQAGNGGEPLPEGPA
jgi:hypothetical protein